MIHWRFLLQKSYIFVCGIAGAGILTFSFFTINWLGLYFACAIQLFVFIFGAVVAWIAKRLKLQYSYKQAIFDGMLVGLIACIPIGFTAYNFLLYGMILFICEGLSSCLDYYSIPKFLAGLALIFYAFCVLVTTVGASIASFSKNTSQ